MPRLPALLELSVRGTMRQDTVQHLPLHLTMLAINGSAGVAGLVGPGTWIAEEVSAC